MSAPPKATLEDLERLYADLRAEIFDGVIVEKQATRFEHGQAQLGIAAHLHRRFHRVPGGRWPGGWWLAPEIHVQYDTHVVYCHDIAGWRRERVADPLKGVVTLRPDWVCEILSDSSEKRDRIDKFRTLQAVGVPHYWLVDAEQQIVVVHRLDGDSYRVVLTATAGEVVRAEPFDTVAFPVDVLFDQPADEE